MMNQEMRMPNKELGPGERATRQRTRAMIMMLAGCMALGGVIGAVLGGVVPSGAVFIAPETVSLPPVLAMALAFVFVVVLIAVPAYLFRKIDEMQAQRNLISMAAGWLAVIGGYPAWQMLAAGGLVAQPSAPGVFLLAYGTTAISYIVIRIRG